MKILNNLLIDKNGVSFVDKHGNSLSISRATKKILDRFKSYIFDFELFVVHFVSDFVPFWSVRRSFFRSMGMKIQNSTIHMGVRTYNPRGISIGKDTIIGFRSTLDGRDALKIGNHVDIASEVMIYNSEHNIHSDNFEAIDAPVTIEDYVFIGPRAIILPGVTLHKGAVVAAGAIVTKDVEENTIVAGIPAKPIGVRKSSNHKYVLGRAQLFQ